MKHAATIAKWYEAVRSGDADFLASVTTETVEVFWNGDPGLIAWAGLHRGRAAVLQFFGTISHHVTIVEIKASEQFTTDDAVIVLAAGRWVIRHNGRTVTARMANVFKFEGDRVAAWHVYNDSAAFLVGLGALTVPP